MAVIKGYHYTTVASAESIARRGFDNKYFGEYWGPGVYACLPDHWETRRSAAKHAGSRGRLYFSMDVPLDEPLKLGPKHYRIAEVEVEAEVPDEMVLRLHHDERHKYPSWDSCPPHDVLVCDTECQWPLYSAFNVGQWVARHPYDVRVVGWRDVTNDPLLFPGEELVDDEETEPQDDTDDVDG